MLRVDPVIIVASDVHLGYEKSNSESFARFLGRCAGLDLEHFVLLGDLLDFWRSNNAQAIIGSGDILGGLGRLKAGQIHYVPGNHDFLIHKLAERYPERYPFHVCKKLTLEQKGTVYNFIHGHELEVLANLEPMTIEAYEKMSERMCFTEHFLGGYASFLWDLVENRHELAGKAEYVRKPAHERGFDRVRELATSAGAYLLVGMRPGESLVYGHTHRPFIDKEKGVVNTGSWVDEEPEGRPRNTYVTIEGGRMELREFGKDTFP